MNTSKKAYTDSEKKIIGLKAYDNLTRKDALIWQIVDNLVGTFGYDNIHFLALNYDNTDKASIIYHCHLDGRVTDVQNRNGAILYEIYHFNCLNILIINSDLRIDAIEVTFLI